MVFGCSTYPPPPSVYTKDLREIVSKCLNVNPSKRPKIQDILRMPIVKNRILNFLDEIQYNKEFSKTIAKQYKENKKNQVIQSKENAIIGLNNIQSEPSNISGNSILVNNKKQEKNKCIGYIKKIQ